MNMLSALCTLLFIIPSSFAAKKIAPECDESALSSNLNIESVYPGTIVRVKAGVDRYPLTKTLMIGSEVRTALPGDEMLVLAGPQKVGDVAALVVTLRVLRTGEGDWVWLGSSSRAMKVIHVGRVTEEDNGHFKVRVLAGYDVNGYLQDTIPLSDVEVDTVFSELESEIKDRLGR